MRKLSRKHFHNNKLGRTCLLLHSVYVWDSGRYCTHALVCLCEKKCVGSSHKSSTIRDIQCTKQFLQISLRQRCCFLLYSVIYVLFALNLYTNNTNNKSQLSFKIVYKTHKYRSDMLGRKSNHSIHFSMKVVYRN